jgi:hypothetical protein
MVPILTVSRTCHPYYAIEGSTSANTAEELQAMSSSEGVIQWLIAVDSDRGVSWLSGGMLLRYKETPCICKAASSHADPAVVAVCLDCGGPIPTKDD